MHRLIRTAILLPLLVLPVWAGPTDDQVLQLHRLWNNTLAAATDFGGVAPLMSRASRDQIHQMEAKKRQALFTMMKMSQAMYGNARWEVDGHQRQRGRLVYRLVYQGTDRGMVEFPVTEEDGQLVVDLRDR
jgi:hypothetical protein